MECTQPVVLVRQPMVVIDQNGAKLFGWFPTGTPTDPAHVLPAEVYAELCRRAGLPAGAPWVAFHDRLDAIIAMAAACLTLGFRLAPSAT
jgi:hypothetical protein